MQKFNSLEELNGYYLQVFIQASNFKQFTFPGFFNFLQRRLKKRYKKDLKIFSKYEKKTWRESKLNLNVKVKKSWKELRLAIKPSLFQKLFVLPAKKRKQKLEEKKKNLPSDDASRLDEKSSTAGHTSPRTPAVGAEKKAAPRLGKAMPAEKKAARRATKKAC